MNVCNALLELLTDEDEEVRNAATEAASELAQSRTDQPANKLPTSRAVEELVAFGLRELGDCSNWFQPVVDVLLVPWRDDVKDLQQSPNRSAMVDLIPFSVYDMDCLNRHYLFESGDGVNVYAEKVNNNIVYHKMLR